MADVKKILVVDDDPDVRLFLSTVLDKEKEYEVITAIDGDDAMKKVQENRPDLILLDLLMPKESGIQFLSKIKQDDGLKDVPIVIHSGAQKTTGVDLKYYLEHLPYRDRKAKALGRDVDLTPEAYLEKPVEPKELLATVKKYLR